jgi:arsenate reductase (glutaredoxin)
MLKTTEPKITIYHNKRCAKSRMVLDMLKSSGKEYHIVEYLKAIPSILELKKLIIKLNLKPIDIIRKTESIYKEKFKAKQFSDEEWLKIIHEYPILIERPIVEIKHKAIICRPPERLKEIVSI